MLMDHYKGRPEALERVQENVAAYERLKRMAYEPSRYYSGVALQACDKGRAGRDRKLDGLLTPTVRPDFA